MPGFVENPSDVIAKNRSNSQVGSVTYRFPKSEDIPYMMMLNFQGYNFNTFIDASMNSTNFINTIIPKETIVLPLPLQLNDFTSLETTTSSAAVARTVAGGLDYQAGSGPIADIRFYADLLKNGLGAAAGAAFNKGGVAGMVIGSIAAAGSAAAAQAAGTAGSLLSGYALNPFETVEFKGVKLREHSFTWRLSPSSQDESVALRDIINTIKKNSLPAYANASGTVGAASHALLQYPNLAMISFLGIDQNYYYKLKPCMVKNFGVRYNSGEQLNVFKGGKPVIVELTLELSEIIIHTSADYGGVDAGNVEFKFEESPPLPTGMPEVDINGNPTGQQIE